MIARMIALILCVPLLLSACDDKEKKQEAPPAPEVKISTPLQMTITEWDEYTGRFRAIKEVDVRARVSGYLEKVAFTDGQMVDKGDTLFVIDQRPFRIALNSAQAQFALAKKEYDRGRNLRGKGATSQEDVDQRTQELKAAQAALDRAKLDMEFTVVKAPIAGRVSRHLVDEGNLVDGSDANATILTNIVTVDPIHFYFEASERDLLKYIRLDRSGGREMSRTKANPIEVMLQDETQYLHKGVMDFVDNRVDTGTGTMQGRGLIDNPEGIIQPGLFGHARLLGSETYSAMLVPDVLISNDQAQKVVYVVSDENTVEIRPVTLGPLYQNSWRIIRGGLKADDRIIAKNIQRIRPGMNVKPVAMELSEDYPLPKQESAAIAPLATDNTEQTPESGSAAEKAVQ